MENSDVEWLIVAKTKGVVYGGRIQPLVMSRSQYRELPIWREGEYEVYESGLLTEADAEIALLSAPTTR